MKRHNAFIWSAAIAFSAGLPALAQASQNDLDDIDIHIEMIHDEDDVGDGTVIVVTDDLGEEHQLSLSSGDQVGDDRADDDQDDGDHAVGDSGASDDEADDYDDEVDDVGDDISDDAADDISDDISDDAGDDGVTGS